MSPKEAIRMFEVKELFDGSELEANDEAHLLPYKLYRKLQNNVGIVSDAKQFTEEKRFIRHRREAIQGGMSLGQYIIEFTSNYIPRYGYKILSFLYIC